MECVQNRKTGAAEAAEGIGRVRDALVELQRADGESILSGQRGQNRRMLCAFYALKLCGRGRISAARSRMIDTELQLKSLEKILIARRARSSYETCFVISFLINHKTGSAIRRCLPD